MTDSNDIPPGVMRELHRLQQEIDGPIAIKRSAVGDRVASPAPAGAPARPDGLFALLVFCALSALMVIGVALAIAGGRL